MKLSRFLLPTLREAPADADNVSARLMQRAGMIRKVASGIYDWLPLGQRTLQKVSRIVREEMDAVGGLEVSLPVIQPKALWEETGRWQVYGKELLRLADRKDAQFCFSPTAEEVVTDLVRREVRSYRQLPLMLYQIGLKFRDEIRPRFGVMRAREFVMKDAYSFHVGDEDADRFYKSMVEAYKRIFTRCGLKFKPVEAQSGAIGGSFSHEFMVLAATGEETVVSCSSCEYGANLERAEIKDTARQPDAAALLPPEEFATPGASSVAAVSQLCGEPPSRFLKTQLYMAGAKPVMALVRGDHELNEAKLASATGSADLRRCSEAEYEKILNCAVGYAGPQGRNGLRILPDYAIRGVANGVTGANKKDVHARNINAGRDFPVERYYDLRSALPEDPCPRCGSKTEFVRGIEVGHTFKLGTKYSSSLKAVYLDKDQKPHTMVMGCYGIGVTRVVAAAIEQGNDAEGILWPPAIAPFQCALVILDELDNPAVRPAADALLKELELAGVDVLEDDRDLKPGVKFKDIDLTGIPFRFVLGSKMLAESCVEFKRRGSSQTEKWPLGEAVRRLTEKLAL